MGRFTKLTILEPKRYLETRRADLLRHADSVAFSERDPVGEADIVARLCDCDAVVAGRTDFKAASLFDALPKLRYIGIDSTDYSMVNMDLAAARGVAVTHVPGYSTLAVAEYVFAQLLAFFRRLPDFTNDNAWRRREDYMGESLAGRTMGIVGFGRIGSQIAKIARAFEMNVIVTSRTPPATISDGVRSSELEALLRQSDVVVVACDLNPSSFRLLNAERLACLKPSCVLVNVARGDVVDCVAIKALLERGALRGAILDVFRHEPRLPDCCLRGTKGALCTPHIAWKTVESLNTLADVVLANIESFLGGGTLNRVR